MNVQRKAGLGKRFCAVLLAAILLLTAMPFSLPAVYAEDLPADDQIEYTVASDSSVTATIKSTASGVVEVPASYQGIPVRVVRGGTYPTQYGNATVTEIILPDTVTKLYCFRSYTALKRITIPDSVESIDSYCFSECTALEEVVLPAEASFGERAFYNCTSLKSVTIPDGVTELSYAMFYYCLSLEEIRIPDSVVSIGRIAFSTCSALKTVYLGDGLNFVGNSAFDYCRQLDNVYYEGTLEDWVKIKFESYPANPMYYAKKLYLNGELFWDKNTDTDLVIPDTVESIGDFCFTNFDAQTVTLADSVKQIGYGTFCYNTKLRQADLGDGIEKIGASAFLNCSVLTDISVGDRVRVVDNGILEGTAYYKNADNWENGVLYLHTTAVKASNAPQNCVLKEGTKAIAAQAFANAGSAQIVLPDSLEYVNYSAFFRSQLTAISAGDRIVYIGLQAFYGTPFFNNSDNWNNGVLYLQGNRVQYLISAQKLADSSYEIASNTKTIAYGAFSKRKQLQQVTIPQSVTNINDCAFQVTGLKAVDIPDSVTEICYSTFAKCRALEQVDCSNQLVDIGRQAFYQCTVLQDIDLPDTVQTIGQESFYWCYKLQMPAAFPAALQTIGDSAFYYCYSLQAVDLPECVESIGNRCFCSCSAISSVRMTDSVRKLGKEAFGWNNQLTELTLSNALTTIPKGCFNSCTALKDFTWPTQLKRIEQDAFYYCRSLENLVIPDTVEYLGHCAFEDCYQSKSITIGSGLREINCSAFHRCISLQTITIPATVQKICAYAFEECSPWSVVWNDGLKEIGSFAFSQDYSVSNNVRTYRSYIKQIILPDTVEKIGSGTFAHCIVLEYLHIPTGTMSVGEDVLFDTNAYICSTTTDCYAKTYADAHGIEFQLCEHVNQTCTHPSYTSAVTKAPTCKEEGVRTYTCTVCGHTYTEAIPKTDHTPKTMHIEPTCTEPGMIVTFCDVCGDIISRTIIPSPGHKPKTERVEPTCTQEGKEYMVCEICGETLSDVTVLPALDHDYHGSVTKEATCQEEGVITYTCSRCGDSYTEVIPKAEHTEKVVRIEPGCTTPGAEYTVCAFCGTPLSSVTPLPPAGHDYDAVVTKKATCSEEGIMTYTCSRCGNSYTDKIDKKPHTPLEVTDPAPTCTKEGERFTRCSICGTILSDITVLPATGHVFGEWVTVKEPTTEAEGMRQRTCTACGFTETETLPKIPTVTIEDPESGIKLTYPEGAYEGDVELHIEQVFDGAAFNLVDLNSDKQSVFDITTTKDGEAVQPKGKVTVRIPVPDGFDPARCMVYHVSTETGTLELIPARYEDGYIVFETTHFSYYAIVIAKTSVPTIAIRNYTANRTVDYRTTITFSADVTDKPDGTKVQWFADGRYAGDGESCTITEAKKSFTIQARIMRGDETVAESEIETVTVKAGFFDRLKAVFRALFRRLPKVVQEVYDIDPFLRLFP